MRRAHRGHMPNHACDDLGERMVEGGGPKILERKLKQISDSNRRRLQYDLGMRSPDNQISLDHRLKLVIVFSRFSSILQGAIR